eukprot:gene6301-46665_t
MPALAAALGSLLSQGGDPAQGEENAQIAALAEAPPPTLGRYGGVSMDVGIVLDVWHNTGRSVERTARRLRELQQP